MTLVANIKGPPGENGLPGSKIYTAIGNPSDSLGSNNDLYIDSATGNFYIKTSGSWTLEGVIQGAPPSALAAEYDIVSDSLVYRGEAAPGSSTSDSVWRIRKINIANELIEELWASGTSDFDKAWTDRLTYTYS